MTVDEIITQLRTADLPPEEALRAAVAHADALAPLVYAQQARFCRGICLMPEDERLLFFGLHVLAATRHADLWPKLVELARIEEGEIEGLFMDHASTSLAGMMLSVWDGDTDGLLRLIEHADMSDDGKWALFDVLARLTFDGRILRDTTVAFLERYERDTLADPDSMVWLGWIGAVVDLGIVQLEEAIERSWEKPALESMHDRDRQDFRDRLRWSAANPTDASRFDKAGTAAVDDPAEALQWMVRRDELHKAWLAEAATKVDATKLASKIAPDPARDILLTQDESYWLSRFLVCRQVPASTMPIEMLDGFLTALAVGPEPGLLVQCLPLVWDPAGEQQPTWEDDAQSAFVTGLITRMVAAILHRRKAGAAHVPLGLEGPLAVTAAADWAEGFAAGIDLIDEQWKPLFEDRNGAEDALAVIALCDDETEYFGRPATTKERQQIIERLPVILQRLAAFWEDPAKGYPRPQPIKVDKIGRNDPCPCGSGLKFKKCCALTPPPAMQ